MLVDVHTHNPTGKNDIIEIVNMSLTQIDHTPTYFNFGIHPWDIKNNFEVAKELKKLERKIKEQPPIAMGETGLDRTIDTPMDLQKEVFLGHIELAIKYNIDVIVLHCVKAYSDILEAIKNANFTGNFILHDYNGNQQQTQELLKGPFYFSYSRALYNEKMKGHESLKEIPLDRLFLETDDQKDHSIQDNYQRLSAILKVNLQSLEQQVFSNFQQCFKIGISSNTP